MLSRFILIISIFSFFSASCQKKGEDCIYLIPKGFEGNIIIIFNQPDGQDAIYDGTNRIYKIDTTGILKTKFPKNREQHSVSFYAINNNGQKNLIPFLSSAKQVIKDSNQVICLKLEPGRDFDVKNHVDRYFELITVARPFNMDSIVEQRSSFMWKVMP